MKEFLLDLIRQAGEISLDFRSRLSKLDVTFKSERDLVTEADMAVERFLKHKILAEYPEHGIFAEEEGEVKGKGEYRWIIDPIDGTGSFVHGQPYYAVSIAVEYKGEIVLGAVNVPVIKEIFHAEKGGGAYLNSERIKMSSRSKLDQSMIATGFACIRNNLPHNNIPYVCELLPRIRDLRRFGSAASDLSYVACGRIEGYWELNLQYYDVAAGMIILKEAGGKVTDFSGNQDGLYSEIVATNGLVHDELVGVLSQVKENYPES